MTVPKRAYGPRCVTPWKVEGLGFCDHRESAHGTADSEGRKPCKFCRCENFTPPAPNYSYSDEMLPHTANTAPKVIIDPNIPEGKGFASEYLRACCETPIGSEHRPECTVPTERTPEPDCTDDCDRHETCRNRQPQAGLNTAGNPTKVVQKWADPAMFAAEPINADEGPKVYLLSMTADPLGAIAAACKMYKGEVVRDLAEVTDHERNHYLGEILKTKLQAPFEFVKFHFLIEGVTRAFTHQMVRQRTAVYAQESLRFAVKEDLPVGLPPFLAGSQTYKEVQRVAIELADQQHFITDNDRDAAIDAWIERIAKPIDRQRWEWDATVAQISKSYQDMVDGGMPAEDARGLLPHNTLTRLHYSTDLRALLDHAGNRLCTQAQFEWRLVFSRIAEAIRNYNPYENEAFRVDNLKATEREFTGLDRSFAEKLRLLGSDMSWQYGAIADLFRPVCYATGKCEFMAHFDRSCSIRNRVQANHDIGRPSSEWGQEHDVVDGSALVCGVGPQSVVRDEQHRPVFIGAIKPADWLLNPGAAR